MARFLENGNIVFDFDVVCTFVDPRVTPVILSITTNSFSKATAMLEILTRLTVEQLEHLAFVHLIYKYNGGNDLAPNWFNENYEMLVFNDVICKNLLVDNNNGLQSPNLQLS